MGTCPTGAPGRPHCEPTLIGVGIPHPLGHAVSGGDRDQSAIRGDLGGNILTTRTRTGSPSA